MAMGRYVLVDRPHLFPARCIRCGNADPGQYVDLRMPAVEPYGDVWLYLCQNCAPDVAFALECVSASELASVKEKLDAAVRDAGLARETAEAAVPRIAELEKQLQQAQDALQAEKVNVSLLEERIATASSGLSREELIQQVHEAVAPPAPPATTKRKERTRVRTARSQDRS